MANTDKRSWALVMGCDLEKSNVQPRQIVRVNRNGKIELSKPTLRILGFSDGDPVCVTLRDGWCLIEKAARGAALTRVF